MANEMTAMNRAGSLMGGGEPITPVPETPLVDKLIIDKTDNGWVVERVMEGSKKGGKASRINIMDPQSLHALLDEAFGIEPEPEDTGEETEPETPGETEPETPGETEPEETPDDEDLAKQMEMPKGGM